MWNYDTVWVVAVEFGDGVGFYRSGLFVVVELRFDTEAEAVAYGESAWRNGVNVIDGWGQASLDAHGVHRVWVWRELKSPDTMVIARGDVKQDLREIPKPV